MVDGRPLIFPGGCRAVFSVRPARSECTSVIQDECVARGWKLFTCHCNGLFLYLRKKTTNRMQKEGRVTINDVAKAAGVSKGTVDRVLHNRGEVSEKSKKKVLEVIESLGFKPNMYASMLASKKNHKIVCLIPEFECGEFWEITERGIARGAEKASLYGIPVISVKYNQYDVCSFRKACRRILEINPTGVVLAPMFRSETLKFADELHRRGIYYIYIDSKIDDDNYTAYFGMPMYRSGYLCANLLTAGTEAPETIHILRIARDKTGLSDPTMARRNGFTDYIHEHFPLCVLKNIFIDPKEPEGVESVLDSLFADDAGKIKYITMFNSRIHLLADYLRRHNITHCKVVGFDVLEKNVAALKDGFVSILIAQHTDRQAESAISAILDIIVFQKQAAVKDNYVQIDILNKYNCDYYI